MAAALNAPARGAYCYFAGDHIPVPGFFRVFHGLPSPPAPQASSRFCDIRDTGLQNALVNDNVLRVPGHEQHLCRWTHCVQTFREFPPVHVRHNGVSQQCNSIVPVY